MEQDKFVINIGRQLGSGGKAVGEALGRRLGVHVYDKQLINLAAEQSGLCTELFEQADEKKSRSLFSSLIGYLRMPFGGDECGMTDVLSSEAPVSYTHLGIPKSPPRTSATSMRI